MKKATRVLLAVALAACWGLLLAEAGGDVTKLVVVNDGEVPLCAKYWVPEKTIGGGCRELRAGQVWEVAASPKWEGATMWAVRGNCGGEACHTGPPSGVTQFQFTLRGFETRDYYDLSIAAGFNVGVSVKPTNGGCPALSCMGLHACEAGATKTCPSASTDYRVSFKI